MEGGRPSRARSEDPKPVRTFAAGQVDGSLFPRMLARSFKPLLRTSNLVLASTTSILALSYALSPTLRSQFSTTSAILGSSASKHPTMSAADFPKGKSEQEWQAQLSPEQFRVSYTLRCGALSRRTPSLSLTSSLSQILRKKGTEGAGTGEYDAHYPGKGVYECAGEFTPAAQVAAPPPPSFGPLVAPDRLLLMYIVTGCGTPLYTADTKFKSGCGW